MAVLSQTSSRNKNEEFTTIDLLYQKKQQQKTIMLSSKPYTFWLLYVFTMLRIGITIVR